MSLFILTFVTVMLVSGNNLAACIGPTVGAKILSRKRGVLLGAIGFTIGLILQATAMQKSVDALFSGITSELRVLALLVAVIMFVIADLMKVPLSYTMSLAGLLAGLSIANHTQINQGYLTEVVAMWIITPVVASIFTLFLLRTTRSSVSKSFWRRIKIYKISIVALSFSSAFTLGSNTLGLVISTGGFSITSVVLAVIAIFIGSFYLSGPEIKKIAQEFFLMRYPNASVTLLVSTVAVEIATLLHIPLSNTQALSAAVFGASLSYKNKFLSLKPFLGIVAGWVIAPVFSFIIGSIIG